MSLPGYWIANLLSDIVKAYVPIGLIIGLTFLFNLNYQGVWVLLLLFPLAVVPFSYVTSFFFATDTIAQIMTLFMHFLTAGVMSITVFSLQIIP